MPIILRLSVDDFMDGGNTIEDTIETLKYCQDEADIFSASCAQNDTLRFQIDANHFPDGWRSYMAKAIKEAFENQPLQWVISVTRKLQKKSL